jgi:hypothetical protein
MPPPPYLYYFWSVVSFENRKLSSSTVLFFFFLKIVLVLMSLMCFLVNFRVNLSTSVKKPAGILIEIAVNLLIYLESAAVSIVLSVSSHEHRTSLHLFSLL